MQRAFGAVLVAVLVVLSGCSGVLGGGTDEPEVQFTPAPVPTDRPTPTPVPQLAPGLTGEGIENVSALAAAHISFLQNQSFTTRSNYTVLAPNGSVVLRGTGTLRAGSAGERIYSVSERNGSRGYSNFELPVRTEVWFYDTRLFMKQTYTNRTTTYDQQKQERYGASGAGLRYRLEPFGPANTSVAERFTRNGTTLYDVRGNTQGNMSLRLLVNSRGIIHEYRIVRRTPSEENISKLIYETRYLKIGATEAPKRPPWVDKALNQTTPIAEETTTTDY